MSNEIQAIVKWFSDAKPNPTIEDACVQIGCGYEETAERADELADDHLQEELTRVAHEYKSKNSHYVNTIEAISDAAKVSLLDSQCDEIVTRIGEAYMLGFDIIGALNEVIASNDSKRMPDGSFPLDENGKITKESPNFFKPDLSKFI
jgi:hypothetical protein